jgi:DNA-binding PadR family transcriptional regulator
MAMRAFPIGNMSRISAAAPARYPDREHTVDLSNIVDVRSALMGREPQFLGEFEQMVLLAVLCVGEDDDAYGVNVHGELEQRTKRRVARGAVYMTLDRLEKKGLLTSYLTDPTPERGGRAKRCYRPTKPAREALQDSRKAFVALWQGAEL